jgi:hypothetical protein
MMTCRKSVGAERMRDASEVAGGAASMRGRQSRGPFRRTRWLLLILFLGLQIADVVTTNHALAIPGNWEANPIMALYQAQWGAAWWLPKAVAAGWICVAALLIRKQWPMIFAVSYYVIVLAGNLAHS